MKPYQKAKWGLSIATFALIGGFVNHFYSIRPHAPSERSLDPSYGSESSDSLALPHGGSEIRTPRPFERSIRQDLISLRAREGKYRESFPELSRRLGKKQLRAQQALSRPRNLK